MPSPNTTAARLVHAVSRDTEEVRHAAAGYADVLSWNTNPATRASAAKLLSECMTVLKSRGEALRVTN